jgi:hypothetical protein
VVNVQFLFWILDVCVDEERYHFAVGVFNCDVEAIEAAGFMCRYVSGEIDASVHVDDVIGGGKGRENVGNEVTYGGQPVPVLKVCCWHIC